jgi:hypothetical protein
MTCFYEWFFYEDSGNGGSTLWAEEETPWGVPDAPQACPLHALNSRRRTVVSCAQKEVDAIRYLG